MKLQSNLNDLESVRVVSKSSKYQEILDMIARDFYIRKCWALHRSADFESLSRSLEYLVKKEKILDEQICKFTKYVKDSISKSADSNLYVIYF